jgi:hypothetical protein
MSEKEEIYIYIYIMSSENLTPTTEPILQYVKLTEHAQTPTKGSLKSAG